MWLRRVGIAALGLLAVAGAAYWWLLIESGSPSSRYTIDMTEVRRLAQATSGDKPSEIRVEKIAAFAFPGIAVVAGDPWAPVDMPVYAFQLVFPGATAVLDTAMTEAVAKENGATFEPAAYERLRVAMRDASMIFVTHEHMDHIGGLAADPDVVALAPRAWLDSAQAAPAAGSDILMGLPEAARALVRTIPPGDLVALAPGVVAIRARGHTPGSLMVYVQLADGRELLFLGDVAWHARNVELVRQRARLVTQFFLDEDRDAVLAQLTELNRLAREEPGLRQIPGHDGPAMAAAIAAGAIRQGFQAASPAP